MRHVRSGALFSLPSVQPRTEADHSAAPITRVSLVTSTAIIRPHTWDSIQVKLLRFYGRVA